MQTAQLYQTSVDLIKQHQSSSGAFVACPNFATYQYCWLRDGSYIAHAMLVAGNVDSARKFHQWVIAVIGRYQHKLAHLRQMLAQGHEPKDADFLFTRFTLAGFEDHETPWGNFQFDGYGTWLWAFARYYATTNDADLLEAALPAIKTVMDYLLLVWRLPNFDCWEENPDRQHPYSIASVYGGLMAIMNLNLKTDSGINGEQILGACEKMKAFIIENGTQDGCVLKHLRPAKADAGLTAALDASVLGVFYPGSLFAWDDPLMVKTLARLKQTLLSPHGGVYRYAADTYYGGGEWILLAAWLGWVEALAGDRESALQRLAWVAAQADENGWLPEQVNQHCLHPQRYAEWVSRWGRVATPLLWSHAMVIILHQQVK